MTASILAVSSDNLLQFGTLVATVILLVMQGRAATKREEMQRSIDANTKKTEQVHTLVNGGQLPAFRARVVDAKVIENLASTIADITGKPEAIEAKNAASEAVVVAAQNLADHEKSIATNEATEAKPG